MPAQSPVKTGANAVAMPEAVNHASCCVQMCPCYTLGSPGTLENGYFFPAFGGVGNENSVLVLLFAQGADDVK